MTRSRNAQANGNGDDFVVPYRVYDEYLGDDEDSEQHKAKRGQNLRMKSIRHYRHAKTKWGGALESFSPMWFAICISTGGFGIVLNSPFPYHGHWLTTCSSILYVFELVLFVIFSILMIARWIMYPHVALRRALSDPDELGAYAIAPIALMTLAALTASQVSLAWAGHAFTLVAYVMWWISVAWAFLTTLVVLVTLFYTGNQVDRTLTPVMFMAPVSLATAATEAGFIATYSSGISARLAVPQIIVGYFAAGVGLFMAILLYTVYFHRLLSSGWAPVAKRASLFVLIGPCGQLATAFQLLGASANQYMRFAQYKPLAVHPPTSGYFWSAGTASGVDGAGVFFALLVLGFDYLWVCIAFIGVLDAFIFHRDQVSYSLNWWSTVFPMVTFTTAWIELAKSMDSPTFRVLVSSNTVFIAIVFFTNLGFTLYGLAKGSLIFGKTQWEIEEGMMKKADEHMSNGEKQEEV